MYHLHVAGQRRRICQHMYVHVYDMDLCLWIESEFCMMCFAYAITFLQIGNVYDTIFPVSNYTEVVCIGLATCSVVTMLESLRIAVICQEHVLFVHRK